MDNQSLAALQQEVESWANRYWDGEYWPPLANLARLTEEIGELARVVNQLAGHKRPKAGEEGDDLATEFGDALFALTCLANSLNVDLQRGFDDALEKYRVRDHGESPTE